MEISIGSYGKMMFEMMIGKKKDLPKHWASIAAEAKPLVLQLLALNEKMTDGGKPSGYEVVGAPGKDGKPKLSKHKRIKLAQEKDLLTTVGTLKVGDQFWLHDHYDHEMHIGEQDPVTVDDITAKGIYFEMQHCGGHHTERIGPDQKVLKAPDWLGDYQRAVTKMHKGEISLEEFAAMQKPLQEREHEFTKNEYWLKRAEELGI